MGILDKNEFNQRVVEYAKKNSFDQEYITLIEESCKSAVGADFSPSQVANELHVNRTCENVGYVANNMRTWYLQT